MERLLLSLNGNPGCQIIWVKRGGLGLRVPISEGNRRGGRPGIVEQGMDLSRYGSWGF